MEMRPARIALCMMAKAPEAGQVKTRLCPPLSPEEAAQREHDVVLGPSEDGGYYLIGLGRIHRALFEDMPWSTSVVLEETLRCVRDLGLTATQLEPWYDVDTRADLDRLAAELEAGGDKGPRHTRRLLLSLGRTSASGGGL